MEFILSVSENTLGRDTFHTAKTAVTSSLLLNEIMDLLLLFMLILSAVSGGVLGDRTSESKTTRYDGYDLRKGPVLYNAYYANDLWGGTTQQRQPIETLNTEYSNYGRSSDETYKTGGRIYDAAYKKYDQLPQQTVFEPRWSQSHEPRSTFPYRTEALKDAEGSKGHFSTSNTKAYDIILQLENFVETLKHVTNVENYSPTGAVLGQANTGLKAEEADLNSGKLFSRNIIESSFQDEKPPNSRSRAFRREYTSLTVPTIANSDQLNPNQQGEEEIRQDTRGSQIPIRRNLRYTNFQYPPDHLNTGMPGSSRHSIILDPPNKPALESRRQDNNHWQNVLMMKNPGDRANDLYIFSEQLGKEHDMPSSAPCISGSKSPLVSVNEPAEPLLPLSRLSRANSEPPKKYDKFVDISINSQKSTPCIASIEVSDVPRHKIRHNHGDKARRNLRRH